MLDSLNNELIGKYRLHMQEVGRTRYFDQRDFALALIDPNNNNSEITVFRGLYNPGRASTFVPGWIDGEFIENDWGHENNAGAFYEAVATKLGGLIPPGGRLWLAYEAFGNEGELMRETRAGLFAQVPLVTTPIGFLLYRADCWLGIRDWLFPEGGREGPRKLQGNKAVDAEHMRQRARETIAELEKFVSQRTESEIQKHARARAEIILPAIESRVK